MLRCTCPSCLKAIKVPPDIAGKQITCPACHSGLTARTSGGKTILALAGVDGSAPTQAMPAVEPPRPVKRPQAKKAMLWPWLLGGAIVAVGLLTIAVVGIVVSIAAIGRLAATDAPAAMSAAEFEQKVKACRTKKEIMERIGKPDDSGGTKIDSPWLYRDRVMDPITGKAWSQAWIYFADGTEVPKEITYY